METRLLAEDDAQAYWDLRREALETEPYGFGSALQEHLLIHLDEFRARLRNTSSGNFLLGTFDADRLVAIVAFARQTGLKEKHKGQIFSVYVTPAYRGKHVARDLLSSLFVKVREDQSLEQILLTVTNHQHAAQNLYRTLGFEIFGTEPKALKVGSSYVDEHHMILWLR